MNRRKQALVFEPCPYHYTLLGSYAYYLSELDYEVTLFVHESCKPQQDIFGAWQLFSEVRFFSDENWGEVKDALIRDRFDLIWVTTINIPAREDGKNLFEVLGGYPHPPDGLFGTLHDVLQLDNTHIRVDEFAQIFTLSDKRSIMPQSCPISLSYYGPPRLGKELTYPYSLLSVGVSVSLCGAMRHIAEDVNIDDFSISRIGRRSKLRFWGGPLYARYRASKNPPEHSFPPEGYPSNLLTFIRAFKKLEFLGNVDSEIMYKMVEKSDYLVANFEGEMLHIFSKLRVSGVALLSLGFNVPMLVNETIAKSWGFDETNSIIFPDGRFDIALNRIRNMTSENYADMQSSLLNKQKTDLASSLGEIRKSIFRWRDLRCFGHGGEQ